MAKRKQKQITEDWDTGKLGRDSAFVRRASSADEASVDAALGLQMISLRLPRELVEEFKDIAAYRGLGYQPLMRDVLTRWACSETLAIADEIKRHAEARELLRR